MFIPSKIAELQQIQDQKLQDAILEQTTRIRDVHSDMSNLNTLLSSLRRKSKKGSDKIDMSEAEHHMRNAHSIFEKLKVSHPDFINEKESLFDLEAINFAEMKLEQVEEMMDKIANAITVRQNEIPEITQMLKLATDLNEIISKIIQEMAKEYKRNGSSIVGNIGRA